MTTADGKAALTGFAAALALALVFCSILPSSHAQNAAVSFTTADRFGIPGNNATISFAVNGSCSSALLVDKTWIFENLVLNDSQPLGTLKFSAENSNITIRFYRAYNFSFRSAILSYNVAGVGKQTVNLGLNTSQTTSSEWSVIVPNSIFLAEGEGWTLLPGNTVVITVAASSVTVVHYNFIAPEGNSNLPFYEQHSVAVVTVGAVAVIVAAALGIRVRKKSNGEMT